VRILTDAVCSPEAGGRRGIRTLDGVASIPPFQDGALDQLCDPSVLYILPKTTSDYFTTLIPCTTYLSQSKLDMQRFIEVGVLHVACMWRIFLTLEKVAYGKEQ
jgi:hypothetical protein